MESEKIKKKTSHWLYYNTCGNKQWSRERRLMRWLHQNFSHTFFISIHLKFFSNIGMILFKMELHFWVMVIKAIHIFKFIIFFLTSTSQSMPTKLIPLKFSPTIHYFLYSFGAKNKKHLFKEVSKECNGHITHINETLRLFTTIYSLISLMQYLMIQLPQLYNTFLYK